jgi:hypothetical protein
MLSASNGQRIARKNMKEESLSYPTGRSGQYLPLGMKRFHDWYLRALTMDIEIIEAKYPSTTFGGPKGKIAFSFDDIQTMFHLGCMETNLIKTWCL